MLPAVLKNISDIELFTVTLAGIWLDSNAIHTIENLSQLRDLKCL